MERLVPYKHHRRVTRLATVSGDSAVAAVAEQRRTFSFGGATLARDTHPASRHPRRLLRQKGGYFYHRTHIWMYLLPYFLVSTMIT